MSVAEQQEEMKREAAESENTDNAAPHFDWLQSKPQRKFRELDDATRFKLAVAWAEGTPHESFSHRQPFADRRRLPFPNCLLDDTIRCARGPRL